MRNLRSLTLCILVSWALSSCHGTYYTVKMTKPKRHFFTGYYDAKKDRKKKRVRTVRYKSLKKARGIDAPK